MKDKDTIALFIDADNAPARKIETVLSELALYGVVNIHKAYGNWKNANLKPWEDVLHELRHPARATILTWPKAKTLLTWHWSLT